MNLEQYLVGIESCSDGKVELPKINRTVSLLTAEFGVYDNFPIFLKSSLEKSIEFFMQHQNYELNGLPNNDSFSFIYTPGTVIGRVKQIIWENPPHYYTNNEIKHFEKQKKFNIQVMLWPYQAGEIVTLGKRMENTTWERALALVISDIGRWALAKNISLCLPQSCGWKYLTKDGPRTLGELSRIVYFEPAKSKP